jgi:hypothetical protein
MARKAELSTERFPLDCNIWTLVTVPSRKTVNEKLARGAQRTVGSTVDCNQLLLILFRTAST